MARLDPHAPQNQSPSHSSQQHTQSQAAASNANGANSNAAQAEPGRLFNGINFFVLMRVPTRALFLEQIRNHGGRVVLLEKQADITIADHARRDNPAGSISWRWIEDCIKSNALVDKEKHPAAPKNREVRRPGALVTAKKQRSAFSEEDDVYLYRFIQRKKRSGGVVYLYGNEIYAELERENPRHTLQSWRDRWKKFVELHPPQRALDEEAAMLNGGARTVEAAAPVQQAKLQESPPPVKGSPRKSQQQAPPPQHEPQQSSQRTRSSQSFQKPRDVSPTPPPQQAAQSQLAQARPQTRPSTRRTETPPPQRDPPPQPARISPARDAESQTESNDHRSESLADPQQISPADDEQEQEAEEEAAEDHVEEAEAQPESITKNPVFTQDDRDFLLYGGSELLQVYASGNMRPWRDVSKVRGRATPEKWREYYEKEILPVVNKQKRASAIRDQLPESQPSEVSEDEWERAEQVSERDRSPSPLQAKLHDQVPIKEEPEIDRRFSTPQSQETPRKSAMRRSSQNGLSPATIKGLERGNVPMVIVPSPKFVRFSNEPEGQDTRRGSTRRQQSNDASQQPSPTGDLYQYDKLGRRRVKGRLVPASPSSQKSNHSQAQDKQRSRNEYEVIDLAGAADSSSESDGDARHAEQSRNDEDQQMADGVARRDFSIWQGSDAVEDEKENSRKRKSPSKPHERPDEALDFTEPGTQFRLEPSVQSIGNAFFAVDGLANGRDETEVGRGRPTKRPRISQGIPVDSERLDDNDEEMTDHDSPSAQLQAEQAEDDGDHGSFEEASPSPQRYDTARETFTQVQYADRPDSAINRRQISATPSEADTDQQDPQHGIEQARRLSQAGADRSSEREESVDELAPAAEDYNSHNVHQSIEDTYDHDEDHRPGSHHFIDDESFNDENWGPRYRDYSESESSAAFQTDDDVEDNVLAARARANGYRDTQEILDAPESQPPDLDMRSPPSSPPPDPSQEHSLDMRNRVINMSQDSLLNGSSQGSQQRTPRPEQTLDGQLASSQQSVMSNGKLRRLGPSQQALRASQSEEIKRQQFKEYFRQLEQLNAAKPPPQSQREALDTQALFAADAPALNLSLPQPPLTQSQAQPLQPQSQSQPTTSATAATDSQLTSYISYQSTLLSVSTDAVIWSLERANFNSSLADEVLRHWKRTGLLLSKPGVFSIVDDRVCLGFDAGRMREVAVFHGASFGPRVELLDQMPEMAENDMPDA